MRLSKFTCSIDGCERPMRASGWCTTHYQRHRRHGNTEGVFPRDRTFSERFWSKVDFHDDADGCWMWIGARQISGYGQIGSGSRVGRPMLVAHRVAYELLVGPISEGLEIDHLCRNKPCVNPAHLEPVTHEENIQRHHRRVTTCPNGHQYEIAGFYLDVHGHRRCRICQKERVQRQRQKTVSHVPVSDSALS